MPTGTMKETRSPELVSVLCEHCVHAPALPCPVCAGRKYYLWDPATRLCYRADGGPVIVPWGDSEAYVTRRADADDAEESLSVDEMLTVIGAWAAADSKRVFKLWFQGEWKCSIRPDRSARLTLTFSDSSLDASVRSCYEALAAMASA